MKFWVRWILSVAALILLVGCGGEKGGAKLGEVVENDNEKIVLSDFFFCDEYDGVDEGVEEEAKEFAEFALGFLGVEVNKLEKKDGFRWLIVSGNYVNKSEKLAVVSSFPAEVKFNNSSVIKGKVYIKYPGGIIDSTQFRRDVDKLAKDKDEDFVAAFCVPEKVAKKWKRGTIKIGIDSDDAKMVTLPPDKLERCYKLQIEH